MKYVVYENIAVGCFEFWDDDAAASFLASVFLNACNIARTKVHKPKDRSYTNSFLILDRTKFKIWLRRY